MRFMKALYPFLLTVFMVIGILLGYKIAPQYGKPESSNYNKIRDIIDILDRDYVDTINAQKLFDSTIQEMLHKLDPHSTYISKEDLEKTKEMVNGVFGGVGVRFFMLKDTLCVTNVIAGSPSERVGIEAGDKIIKVEKENIAGVKIKTEDIMKKLKGHPGTDVNITILRDGKMLDKKITRGVIPINSVSVYFMLDQEIGYIKVDEFTKATAGEFVRAANRLKQAGMKKMIIDLRENGGGVLESALQIADEFLPKGKLMLTTKGKNYPKEDIFATGRGDYKDIPLVILINESSASASEVVSGALQDQDRATIIGRRSFGKGLVQQDIPLNDGSDLRLVVARYYTPTGRSIQKPYSDNYQDYVSEYYDRYESGELYNQDSIKVDDSLKYKTPKGKIVYGGGGITPDIFVPLDSAKNTIYIADLFYRGVFQTFSFDYVKDKRKKWKDMYEFKRQFQVTDAILQQFHRFIKENHKDVILQEPLSAKNKQRIQEILKAEIARQIWEEKAYFYMNYKKDNAIIEGIKALQ